MQDHFALFQLPARFAIDLTALEKAYHGVQNQAHPDKFAQATAAEKRVAMQWATRANEAYQTLKNPLKRASYLCELHGVDLQTESNTSMSTAFLMRQMEWREALDDAKAGKQIDALEALDGELRTARKALLGKIEQLLDAEDFAAAAQLVRQLMFLDKFGTEIGDAFALIEG
ncbi:molecular chaperone HscB [Herbaspirillum sp. Sphag1AN]|uniref:Fe-S protein assembly co-chaperone HscB n=1 Tax=unclassified Herbaspirillum TaxID=2624150 RepID=UPI0016127DAE|nr:MULTISPECIES: Fe-S protein assembly co-chaperone HscB [unclassified Herbaspirillum]MBB3213380.1 molecular chaperone HscB [Herbaspirillum sp. Sphag1AN]MBB3246576.1 molecular chaperone HscB [Herbaspirillum sp. Sphag64]